jgi:hypothetical protein
MQIGIEQIAALVVGSVAAGLAAFRIFGRQHVARSYAEGRKLRLLGDYDKADQKLAVASVGYPSAQYLRFWMMIETLRIGEARALAKEIPPTLGGQECRTWLALRHDTLSKAEEEVARLLHLMNLSKDVQPYMEASTLYTHACLLIEEGSLNFALEKLTNAIRIARDAYGMDSIYTVPPAVALAYLYYLAGNFEKSAKLLAAGLRAYKKGLSDVHPRTARVRAMLGIVAAAVGADEIARKELTSAANCFHQSGLDDSEEARTSVRALARLRKPVSTF